MNDLTMQTTDHTGVVEPITASADGKRNSFTLYCVTKGQSMNYAACLWRQGVLEKPEINTPADWDSCKKACNSETCTALMMRKEELVAGKSIYFQARDAVRKATDLIKEWMPSYAALPKPKTTPPMPSVREPKKEMLDAIGDAGTFADAITELAKEPAKVVAITSTAGESPLAMARRINAERKAQEAS